MRAAAVGEGDEVIVPAHTYIASAFGVSHARATPVFCDVDSETGLIDLASAAAAVCERTAAVMPVHLYGQACDMDAIQAFADDRGIAVFEDAAQAHGASWRGRKAGSFGAFSAFSFYPSKNLGAFGDAGAIATNDPELATRARELRDLGQRSKGYHVTAGYNARLDTLQAAILRVKLPTLDDGNSSRRDAAAVYRSLLPTDLRPLAARDEASDVYHLFPVRTPRRDEVRQALTKVGIGTGIHYHPAVHLQPPYRSPETPELPVAEEWAGEELSLPMFASLREDEVAAVCERLQEAIAAVGVDADTVGSR